MKAEGPKRSAPEEHQQQPRIGNHVKRNNLDDNYDEETDSGAEQEHEMYVKK